MRAKERSGRVIKKQKPYEDLHYGKGEVYQPLSFLVERFGSDWVYGNNFIRVTVSEYSVKLRLGVKKDKYKEIDISKEGAVRMAKLILAEYESQDERFGEK